MFRTTGISFVVVVACVALGACRSSRVYGTAPSTLSANAPGPSSWVGTPDGSEVVAVAAPATAYGYGTPPTLGGADMSGSVAFVDGAIVDEVVAEGVVASTSFDGASDGTVIEGTIASEPIGFDAPGAMPDDEDPAGLDPEAEEPAEEGDAPPADAPPAEAPPAGAAPAGPLPVDPGPAADDAFGAGDDLRDAAMADRRRFLVQRKVDAARDHIANGEYPQARKLLDEALDLDPSNSDARYQLRIVQGILGDRGANQQSFGERATRMAGVRIEEQRTKAAKLTNLGRMHLANQRYDSAIESFEDALHIINTSPYSIDWTAIEDDATNGLRAARAQREEAARNRRRDAVEAGLSELARAEEQELIREMERLAQWMGAAIEAFERNQFDAAEDYANRILDAQPDNCKARELADAARRAQHDKRQKDFLRNEKIAFRSWYDDIQNTRIPQDRILRWPSRSFWDRITEVRSKSRVKFGEVETDPEGQALMQKVEGETVNLSVEEQEFREVIQTLQIQTGFNIVIDPRIASDVADQTVSGLVLTDTSLSTVLNILQRQFTDSGVVWTTKGNVVLFTSKANLQQNMTVEIHPVADLTSGLTDFIPPTIQLVGPDDVSDEENPLFGTEAEEPVFPYGQVEELIELVKTAVSPSFWEESEGAEIKSQGEQVIVVKATPEIQEGVAKFLDELRGFAGIVVTVESRFLEVNESFLRDVGVDFRGLGGQTPGTLVNLDDVTNGLEDNASAGFDNGGTGNQTGAALSPSAGAYFNEGADGDFRARTENIFDNALGTVLSSVGGATLTLAYLDDTQISMIIRATEKTLSARTLTAPVITVYNTQRANLTMVNQISYIQDFDVEVAQTSFIADPIVGIIQDGLTLDVRPTVSNDRRYITLELQPTVATLRRPIQEFATSLASSFAPVIIQLPELRLQQARTTVRIPDQGTILIGGLKEIQTVDQTSKTPILGDLPLLTFLFSRKGRSDEVNHLLIIVKATITDLTEQEERFLSR